MKSNSATGRSGIASGGDFKTIPSKITIGFRARFVVYATSAFDSGADLLFNNLTNHNFMSQHRSLRAASTLGGKRNVLKRFERTELLKKRGQWKDGDRITGLRKTKPEA